MKQPRVRALFLFLTVFVAVASGCAGETGMGKTESGLLFLQYKDEEPGVGNSALLSGVVDGANACLTVNDSETGTLYTPIFPTSTDVAMSLSAGDRVELRGGVQYDLPEDVALPDECSADGPFWLVVADA